MMENQTEDHFVWAEGESVVKTNSNKCQILQCYASILRFGCFSQPNTMRSHRRYFQIPCVGKNGMGGSVILSDLHFEKLTGYTKEVVTMDTGDAFAVVPQDVTVD